MDKLILKKVAKEWCKAILLANDGHAFDEAIDTELLTEEEADYLIEESGKIANRITKEFPEGNITEILRKYYKIN